MRSAIEDYELRLWVGKSRSTHLGQNFLEIEATEGPASLIVAEIWRLIGDIRGSGFGTLIVDRSYRAALAPTHRAVVLEQGLIFMQCDPDTLAETEMGQRLGF